MAQLVLFFVVLLADLSGCGWFFVRFSAPGCQDASTLICALVCAAAFLSTAASFFLSRKQKKGSAFMVCTILSVLCNLWVAFCAAVWILSLFGLYLIPPPQQ